MNHEWLFLKMRSSTELLGDPARAEAMGRRGLAWAEQEWDWTRVAGRLDAILRGQA